MRGVYIAEKAMPADDTHEASSPCAWLAVLQVQSMTKLAVCKVLIAPLLQAGQCCAARICAIYAYIQDATNEGHEF
jgi:hypothetical protein